MTFDHILQLAGGWSAFAIVVVGAFVLIARLRNASIQDKKVESETGVSELESAMKLAKDIFGISQELQQSLRKEIHQYRDQLQATMGSLEVLLEKNKELIRENERLIAQNKELVSANRALISENETLREEVRKLIEAVRATAVTAENASSQ